MSAQSSPSVNGVYIRRASVARIALIISFVILAFGVLAVALQITVPEFDAKYDAARKATVQTVTNASRTQLDNLLEQNAKEAEALSALGVSGGASKDNRDSLEAVMTEMQSISAAWSNAAGEDTANEYSGFLMLAARYRVAIIATGALLLIISALVYIANNKRSRLCVTIVRDKWLYILLAPGFIYFVIFKYLPMWGVVIAFQEFVPFSGIFMSKWVGFDQFIRFFNTPMLKTLFANTLILSFMNLVMYFPAPILLALLLNEMRKERYKKLVQTFLYVPHFISIVIVVSITYVVFDAGGLMGRLDEKLLGKNIEFLTDPGVFRWMIVGQSIWKETGWGTIIFLAALTSVDVQLYEAAMVDGAGRLRQTWHITLPAIRSTIVLLLILRMGSVLDTGYDHLILMSNAMNRVVSQTFDVFVYEQGIAAASPDYSYATAVGLFKSIISVTLVISSNSIAHALGEQGLY